MNLVTAKEMQEMDRQTIEDFGIPGMVLMENAGRGATQMLMEQFPDIRNKKTGIMAGRGNNGGDGFVIARYLSQKGINVTVYLLSEKNKVKGDAAANLELLDALGTPVIEMPDKTSFSRNIDSLMQQQLWVDAVLGTGLKSDVKGYFKEIIEFLNRSNRTVFSVDIPSGLNSDTGQPCGVCVKAHATATFAFAKVGHILYPGADYTGELEVIDIGIPPHISAKVGTVCNLITRDMASGIIQLRPSEAHKGSTGHLLVVAGSPGKTGAAAMTTISAMRAGAGLVTLGIPKSLNHVVEPMVLEAMTAPLPETKNGLLGKTAAENILKILSGKKCLAIGPGIGTSASIIKLVQKVVSASKEPVVVDADGLTCIAENINILKKTKAPVILTPHPGEMARLVGSTPDDIQKNRVSQALNFARKYNVHTVLKGARTVIAHPDGRVFINPTGNPGMASGGMGDVLTGVIAGFIAQGYSPDTAAQLGVYLHGAAADELAESKGVSGFLASDVMNALPGQISGLMK